MDLEELQFNFNSYNSNFTFIPEWKNENENENDKNKQSLLSDVWKNKFLEVQFHWAYLTMGNNGSSNFMGWSLDDKSFRVFS